MHLADIVYNDEGVYGDGVNVAARIESLSVSPHRPPEESSPLPWMYPPSRDANSRAVASQSP
jgi:hypothetical protein